MKAWIKAARLRTLPLAICGILTGVLVGYEISGSLPVHTFTLLLSTALLLQVLSNFANDYGDFTRGTDNAQRIGPERALQSGKIRPAAMRAALYITAFITLASGLCLVFTAKSIPNPWIAIGFIVLGLSAIAAAIKYTVGKKAYGYSGLGDIFVMAFFGWTSVYGSFFLVTGLRDFSVILPASSIGFFAAAVLNMNNMRDVENDLASGKITIPARMSLTGGKVYHSFLVLGGIITGLTYLWIFIPKPGIEFVSLAYIPFLIHLITMWNVKNRRNFDPHLKWVVLSTLVITLAWTFYIV